MRTSALSRRELLATVALPALGGCSALGDDEDRSISVVTESFEVTERRCADDGHDATVAFGSEPSSVAIRGQFATATPCDRLDVSRWTSVDRDYPGVIVEVETDRSSRTCEPCPATLEYRVSFELNRTPETVHVLHYPPTSDGLSVTSTGPEAAPATASE